MSGIVESFLRGLKSCSLQRIGCTPGVTLYTPQERRRQRSMLSESTSEGDTHSAQVIRAQRRGSRSRGSTARFSIGTLR